MAIEGNCPAPPGLDPGERAIKPLVKMDGREEKKIRLPGRIKRQADRKKGWNINSKT